MTPFSIEGFGRNECIIIVYIFLLCYRVLSLLIGCRLSTALYAVVGMIYLFIFCSMLNLCIAILHFQLMQQQTTVLSTSHGSYLSPGVAFPPCHIQQIGAVNLNGLPTTPITPASGELGFSTDSRIHASLAAALYCHG